MGIRKPHEKISEVSEAKPRDIEYICNICVRSKNAANTIENQNENAEISKKVLILSIKHIKIVMDAMAKTFALKNITARVFELSCPIFLQTTDFAVAATVAKISKRYFIPLSFKYVS